MDDNVGVLVHQVLNILAQANKDELQSLSAGQFHCRNEIAVTGYEYNDLYLPFECKGRNIQPYPHIDTLLLNIGFEVVGRQGCEGFSLADHFVLDFPAAKTEFAIAHRDVGKP